jgi:hypothetical protein
VISEGTLLEMWKDLWQANMDAFFKNASRIHFRIKALARKCIS